MKDFSAAAVQLESHLFDPRSNTADAVEAARQAARDGAELIVLPELFNVGYLNGHEPDFMAEYYSCAEEFPGKYTTALGEVAQDTGTVIVAGFAEKDSALTGVLHNSAAVLGPEGTIGVYRKTHIPREEKHYFRPGDGLPTFDTPVGKLGVLICGDASFPEAARVMALAGAEVISVCYAAQLQPSPDLYRWITATRAYEQQVFVVSANHTGEHGGMTFAGTSTIAAPDGAILNTFGRECGVIAAELSGSSLLRARLRQTRYRDRRPDLYASVV